MLNYYTLEILVIEEQLVHSRLAVSIMEDSVASLLTILPNNGKVEYHWEKGPFLMIGKKIEVQPWTCLLYVDSPSHHRCTVERFTVVFNVKGGTLCVHSLIFVMFSLPYKGLGSTHQRVILKVMDFQ